MLTMVYFRDKRIFIVTYLFGRMGIVQKSYFYLYENAFMYVVSEEN